MDKIFGLVVFGGIIFILIKALEIFVGMKVESKMPYKGKKILTETERIFFHRLRKALPEYVIITQVQMSGLLAVTSKGKERQSALNRILMKSVDFIVCEQDFSVITAIELQDKSHGKPARKRSDEFKRAALKAANINLLEYHAEFMPTHEEIRKTFFAD